MNRSEREAVPGILTLQEAVEWRKSIQTSGKRVVFTNGCFDILHRVHIELLREAARLGDYLIVGLNSDDSVTRLKGSGRPFIPQAERAEILTSIRWVDGVVIFQEETPHLLIDRLRPDVLVKGGDYRSNDVVGNDIVRGDGGEVVIVPYVKGRSTSHLIRAIRRTGKERCE
jgi:D-beta-D-heptose 7-phosphate kinase/D-beta-D-heptose 1-phosphate adenosyltransferase